MSETNLRIVSTTDVTEDVETLRSEAESIHGADWSPERFFTGAALYSVIYEDDVPTVVGMLQQHPVWINNNIWGLCRKYYTRTVDTAMPSASSAGKYGELMFVEHYNKGKELGYKKFMISQARSTFVDVAKVRLPRYQELTGEQWNVGDGRYYTLLGVAQYVMWNGTGDCWFEAEA
jgi:hypothetical protein